MKLLKKYVEEMFKSCPIAEEFFDHHHYKWNKFLFKLYGLWPYQDQRLRAAILFFIVVISTLTAVGAQVMLFIGILGDVGKMVELVPGFLVTYMIFVMLFNSVINTDKFKKTLDLMRFNRMNLTEEKDIEIFDEYAERGRFWTLGYTSYLGIVVTLLAISPMGPIVIDMIFPLNESRPLKPMIEAEYFVDVQNKKNFFLIHVHQVQLVICHFGIAVAADTYYVMVVKHACSLFAILSYKIKNIERPSNRFPIYISQQQKDQILVAKLNECIRHHWDCFRFYKVLDESMCVSWFFQIFTNMVLISVIGVQIIYRSDGEGLMFIVSSGFNVMTTLFRLYWISWPGQELLDHSSEIHTILYDISWYKFPLNSKKVILLMLLRSSYPCHLTAGKMLFLNLETFAKLAKTSFSVFLMIRSFE